ncbi:hypothetical protein V8E36_005795 [Tilletia maclaganii]
MQFLAILSSLVLTATSALALSVQPTIENTDPVLRALRACQAPSSATGIIRPKANATLTATKPFLFSFCSPTYFKTSSNQILVGFESPYDSTAANLISINLKPGQYTQNLTFYNGDVSAGARKLVVYEVQNGYYNSYNFVKYVQPVNIKASN